MRRFLTLLFCIIFIYGVIALPGAILAQTTPHEPAQDPFALTPEKLRLFQGYEAGNSLNSLFDGGEMQYNGLFTTTMRQLGGASPDLTAPIRDNEEEVQQGPTFLVIRSEYTPSGDLTKDSIINLKVTLHNIGQNTAEDIVFTACVQDNYIILLDDPAPEPPFTNDPVGEIEADEAEENIPEDSPEDPGGPVEPEPTPLIQDPTINDCYMRLEWDALEDGEPITLEPDEEATFTWSFQPQKDDVVIRWRFVAEFGAGQSVLRQWIPVKNPNPTGGVAPGGGPGIPSTCSTTGQTEPYPTGSPIGEIINRFFQKWNISLVNGGSSWTDPQYEPLVKIYWETLSAVECTPFITMITGSEPLNLEAGSNPSLWGDYTSPPNLRMHLPSILNSATSNPEFVQQNLIHELGHVLRGRDQDIFNQNEQICGQGAPNAYVSGYGDTNCSENLSEILGYYAIRASTEWGIGEEYCAAKNPYDWGQAFYYNWAKENVFGGIEFGPPPPDPPTSC